ncbi:MAG: 5'/3'-nucleotidase SurE [Planctomycetota bacterium]
MPSPADPIRNILLTNDDGIDAPGLLALEKFVHITFGESARVVVVAPDRGRSECGHGVENAQPLTVREHGPNRFSVSGTPVNCVRLGLNEFLPNADWVFSGINQGANLGVDVLVSGTVAAAREAALQGVRSIALSHYRHPAVPKSWDHVPRWLGPAFQWVLTQAERTRPSRPTPVWNINLPALDPEMESVPWIQCPIDPTPIPLETHRNGEEMTWTMDFHGRPRMPAGDVDRCFSGHITVSQIHPHLS